MSIIIFIGGLVLVFIGMRKIYVSKSRGKSWLSAQGKVSEVRMHRNWGGKKIFTPIVTFYNQQGQQLFFNSGSSPQFSYYNQGQEVAVLYNPHNHSEAVIKGAIGNIFWTIFFIILGGGMFFLGIVTMILEFSFYYSMLR